MNTPKEFTDRLFKLILIIFLLLPSISYGRFLVEPTHKNFTGSWKRSGKKGTISGWSNSLAVGYIGEKLMLGLNFELGKIRASKRLMQRDERNYRYGGVGTFLGFHFLDRFKLWTGYLNTSLEPHHAKDYRLYGQQISYGLGLRLTEGLMANYEYFSNFYTQEEDDETGQTSSLKNNIRTSKQAYSLSYVLIF